MTNIEDIQSSIYKRSKSIDVSPNLISAILQSHSENDILLALIKYPDREFFNENYLSQIASEALLKNKIIINKHCKHETGNNEFYFNCLITNFGN